MRTQTKSTLARGHSAVLWSTLWNRLPGTLHKAEDIASFWRQLKSLLSHLITSLLIPLPASFSPWVSFLHPFLHHLHQVQQASVAVSMVLNGTAQVDVDIDICLPRTPEVCGCIWRCHVSQVETCHMLWVNLLYHTRSPHSTSNQFVFCHTIRLLMKIASSLITPRDKMAPVLWPMDSQPSSHKSRL